ncbi:MAG: MATE family efflux transporter [Lachnospiraceae bacterium]|nr:MATE family efflux transporter [Lachnospiraceae bacterium]
MKTNYKQYLRRLLIIAVPIILSNIIGQLQMLIDRIFLGHADDLYMSALSNVTTPMWATMSFCFSLVAGASILISQSVGAGDREHIEEYAGAMIKYNNIIPVLLFLFWLFLSEPVFKIMGVSENLMPMCLSYARFYAPVFLLAGMGGSLSVILQTSNYTQPLVAYGIIRAGLNIVLDYILIFGKLGFPALGIKGAAIGTTIAEYLGAIFISYVILTSKKLDTRPSMRGIKKSKMSTYLTSAKLGINTAFEDFAWNLGNLLLIRILNTINEFAAGIYSIIFGVEVLAVVIVGAIGSGTMTLTSEATGKKDLAQYKGVCICAYALCMIVAVLMIILALTIPEQIIALFTKDTSVITTSSIYLLIVGINLFSKSANIIVGNGIRGSGDTRWMLYTQMFGTVSIVSVAAFFVYVCKLGITGIFLAVLVDEAVRALINLWKYLRIIKRF